MINLSGQRQVGHSYQTNLNAVQRLYHSHILFLDMGSHPYFIQVGYHGHGFGIFLDILADDNTVGHYFARYR